MTRNGAGTTGDAEYLGKYRGTVVNNVDPMQRGRIQARCPTSWASCRHLGEPCVPLAGEAMGVYIVPPIGAGVWIEFEQGDPDYPIWTGAIAGGPLDVPVAANVTPPGVPQTTLAGPVLQHSITVSNSPATGIMMKTPGTAMIMMTDASGVHHHQRGRHDLMQGPTMTILGNLVVI